MPSAILVRRYQLFDSMLGLLPRGRLVDLGTGHGAFALRAAQQGWQVTGVDARADRIPDDPTVTWQITDIREVDLAPYDVIACLGLFYHLELEDQLALLRRCAGTPLILDTHVDNGGGKHPLSERQTFGPYTGSYYREPGRLTSSWINERSFWPTPETLHQMLADHGYPVVLEAHPYVVPDRTFYLALPEPRPVGDEE
ncbi:Methyltransferase domain-containing protein [Friedmanniella luteola]|uniref:Methyltransferase domain-containing protein n=1 Tax=Friedmanniella luteola TaxID=546871 RepID=A0A1H1LD04_9ACTN|nr:class I SAM-dependent methyltransferase [Friedmanniella luteola]SDR72202.1 Methyltransferase domain-containing protein [Friedmanniella luteola]